MADGSAIEWTDATWNPVVGCSVVSAGCTNCYAMKLAGGRLRNLPSRQGLTQPSKAGPVWNGTVRLVDEWLTQPVQWKRPRRIFVCAHGDLFHEAVPDEWIDKVFAVMALAPQHTFQVLTKRSARMREYLTKIDSEPVHETARRVAAAWPGKHPVPPEIVFPLPNVWLGVSTEDQATADERIPHLLATPAAKRFISAEPLLGAISFRWAKWDDWKSPIKGVERQGVTNELDGLRMLDWAIAGGESGPKARPSHPDWFRALRDQCAAAGVPFFFKQWGEWLPDPKPHIRIIETSNAGTYWPDGTVGPGNAADKGGDGHDMRRVGKKAAGAQLDGREHREFPT